MPHALITGATEGIGRAFANQLAGRGCDLTLIARTPRRLDEVAGEIRYATGRRVETIAADLADESACAAVETRITSATPLRVLVNNAGVGLGQHFLANGVDEEDRLLRLNVRAVLRLTHAALPGMLDQRAGAMINVASVAAHGPAWLSSTYPASKSWVLAFTESLAWSSQVRSRDVRIMALLPGYTHTRFHHSAGMTPANAPSWMWLDPNLVVRQALRDLARGRHVSTPSLRYKILGRALRHLPRPATVPFGWDLSRAATVDGAAGSRHR